MELKINLTENEKAELFLTASERQRNLKTRIKRFEELIDLGERHPILGECLSDDEESLKAINSVLRKLE